MNQPTRRFVAGVVVAGAAVLLLGRSGTVGAQLADGTSHWVKIGPYRINGNQIKYSFDGDMDKKELVLDFGTPQNRITLEGAEAEAMRRWLDVRASDPMTAGKTPPPPAAPK